MDILRILQDNIDEVIREDVFDPSIEVLSKVWIHIQQEEGASELLNEAINGDELLSQDVLNLVKFPNFEAMGRIRLLEALCRYAMYFVSKYDQQCWDYWQNQHMPDPMTLAKDDAEKIH